MLKTVLLVTLGLGLAACPSREQTGEDPVLARYQGGELTRSEFDAHVESRARAGRSSIEGDGDWRVTVLKGLAVSEIMARADPESAALDGPIEEATDSVLEAAMIERLGWNEISVSDQEARRYYEEHAEAFVEPEKLRLQHIFLRAPEGTLSAEEREAVRLRLAAVRRQIVNGADFGAMAREHSESADGPSGGWMVLKRGARAVRSFSEVAWSLDVNEISEPIDTPRGFQIARLAARIEPVKRPFEDVRRRARREALVVARRELEDEFLAQKGPSYSLTRNYGALSDRDAGGDTVLFSLAGMEFTLADMLETVRESHLSHYYAGHLEPLRRVLDQLVLRRVLVLEARAEGLESEPTVIRAVQQATQEVRADLEIERRLNARGATTPEQELLDFYEQNPKRYETPRLRSLSVIRLAPEEGRSLRVVFEEGERLEKAIRSGADFAEMARRHSQHVSAASGGRLLELTEEEIRTQVQGRARGRQLIEELQVGAVSEAFVGEVYDAQNLRFEPSGVYIVRLDRDVAPRQMTFDEVKNRVRADYVQRHRGRLLSQLRAEVLAQADFEIVESNMPELSAQ